VGGARRPDAAHVTFHLVRHRSDEHLGGTADMDPGAPRVGDAGQTWSFDVAVTSARLGSDGRRALRPRWVRAVVVADRLVEAHLIAAQLVGCHGMVTEVLLRE
jgi:hypothetical protein